MTPFPFLSDDNGDSGQVVKAKLSAFFFNRRKHASCLRDRASSPRPRRQWDAVPVVWVALLFTREWVTAVATAAPPPVSVSNTLPWQEIRNPGGPRSGSRLLFRFLPFMAVMDFLHFPPFRPLLLYGCGHYVALRKWITRQRSASPPGRCLCACL